MAGSRVMGKPYPEYYRKAAVNDVRQSGGRTGCRRGRAVAESL